MNDMVDMSRFIEAKSDQLNADDLIGTSKTITVTRVTGNDGDQPVSIFYDGDNGKPFKPCKTIRRVLMGVWGRYANDYVGKSMTLYRDDKVTFGGLETGGIRISHMSHIDKETIVVVMKSKGKKAGVKVLPLRIEQRANEALTAEQALLDMEASTTLAELETTWRQKAMAPFRDRLRPDLDRIKARLSEATVQFTPDWLIGKINQSTTVIQVTELVRSWSDAIYDLEEADRTRIAEAQDAKVTTLKTPQ